MTGYLFSDFDFVNDNGQLTPAQNGPFSLPGNAQGTLLARALPIDINVDDDDDAFDDGFQDDNPGALNQILRDEIQTTDAAGNPIFVGAGAVLEVEFTLTATPAGGGAPIDLLFVAAGPGENQGDITLVVSTAPLVPGTTYDIDFKTDGGGTPYGEIICFARGTLILTPAGQTRVEDLRPGDSVTTMDSGAQRIVWHSSRAILFPGADDRPVRVRAGAFGAGQPFADLMMSPQHCLLRRDPMNDVLFDSEEVLIPAKQCQSGEAIRQRTDLRVIEYFHFMLPRHEIVLANGLPVESFYPGRQSRRGLDPAALAALVSLYPALADPEAPAPFAAARRRIKPHETEVARSYLAAPRRAG